MGSKRMFIVESDTEYYSLFAYEVGEVEGHRGVYFREVGADAFAHDSSRENFFGALNRALITRREVEKPEPISLPPAVEAEDSGPLPDPSMYPESAEVSDGK